MITSRNEVQWQRCVQYVVRERTIPVAEYKRLSIHLKKAGITKRQTGFKQPQLHNLKTHEGQHNLKRQTG